jgi:hypothetical protein
MFELFTENARRVIFFARYEASQYGSPYIETEHMLLGLLREDQALIGRFLGPTDVAAAIRTEIERQITSRERISPSIEVPLSHKSKQVLTLAAEESDRLGHRHVGTEHLLVGLLRVEDSLAAKLLRERGLKPGAIGEQLAKAPSPNSKSRPRTGSFLTFQSRPTTGAFLTLNSFLAGLKWLNSEDLISFFAKNAEFIDASGKRWNREEIGKGFETLLAPYAKKNASYVVEATLAETSELLIANVLWENALLASEQRAWMHRMSVVLLPETDDWQILLVQVTPVQPS